MTEKQYFCHFFVTNAIKIAKSLLFSQITTTTNRPIRDKNYSTCFTIYLNFCD